VSAATCRQFEGAVPAFVLPDGLEVQLRPRERAQARGALGLPADAVVAALLGRVSGWKGQDELVRALAAPALRRRADVVALLAGAPARGEERHRRALHQLADRLGVRGRVHDVGFQDDLDLLYGAADMVVVPSRYPDPLPSAAIEGAAAGRCVVAADHGGAPEIVEDGVTGRLVAPRDPTALAAVLAELASDPEQRAQLGAAAAADVPARFARERLLAGIHGLYDRLLELEPAVSR
jgi:glycosyltransferase involved in cell wall biosynthesis